MLELYGVLKSCNLIKNEGICDCPNQEHIEIFKSKNMDLYIRANEFLIFKSKEDKLFVIFLENSILSGIKSYFFKNLIINNFNNCIYEIKIIEQFKIKNSNSILLLFEFAKNIVFTSSFNSEFLFQIKDNCQLVYLSNHSSSYYPCLNCNDCIYKKIIMLLPSIRYQTCNSTSPCSYKGNLINEINKIELYLKEKLSYKEEE